MLHVSRSRGGGLQQGQRDTLAERVTRALRACAIGLVTRDGSRPTRRTTAFCHDLLSSRASTARDPPHNISIVGFYCVKLAAVATKSAQ